MGRAAKSTEGDADQLPTGDMEVIKKTGHAGNQNKQNGHGDDDKTRRCEPGGDDGWRSRRTGVVYRNTGKR